MIMQLLLLQLQVGVLVLFLLVLRLGMKKMPKIYSYVLWLLVFARLLFPAGFESRIGILPSQTESAEWIQEKLEENNLPLENTPVGEAKNSLAAVTQEENRTDMGSGDETSGKQETIQPEQAAGFPAAGIFFLWAAGLTGIGGYNIWVLARVYRKIRNAKEQEKGVYVSELITAPFTIGFRRPKIYLPGSLSSREREYIVYHERVHIRRKDYMIKNLAFLLTCIYWFNPFVWIAFYMMERDMEMSCDEAVVKAMGGGIKKQYSQSLLNFAVGSKRGQIAPLSFGEVGVKQRVKNVLLYKGTKKWIGIAGVLILVAAGIVIFTTREVKQRESTEIGGSGTEQLQASPETLLNRWAEAVIDEDADMLSRLSYEQKEPENWNISAARFYEVRYQKEGKTAVIRYEVYISEEDIYIAEEAVEVLEKDDLYYVKHNDWIHYDGIDTAEEFRQAYGAEPQFQFMFHSYDFWRNVLRQIRSGRSPERYQVYSDPVLSAKQLLHLGEGTGKAEYMQHDNPAGRRADVTYTFEGGGTVTIPMCLIEPSEGIWALDWERGIAFEIYEETAAPDGTKYQASPFGIYQTAGTEMTCIYPYYVGTQPELRLEEDRLYFKTFSRYKEGDLDWNYDSTMYIDLKTGEVQKEEVQEAAEGAASLDDSQAPIAEPENKTTEKVTGIFDALNELEYEPYTCDGLPEYRLTASDGTVYAINFSEKWVWRGNSEQAELSDELIAQLKENSSLLISDKPLEVP